MRRQILLTCLLFSTSFIFAQEALDQLLARYSTDADMVQRLRKFKSDGAEKDFDVSGYKPNDFIRQARSYLGTPYKYGGMSKAGIDCSGLIVKTMQDLGLQAPHNANELAKYGKIILDKSELKPGDLIFFSRTYNTSRLISHAGFVIEGDQMLHASSKGVNITSINNPYYYDKYYLFGTRIFGDEATIPEETPVVSTTPRTEPVATEEDILSTGYSTTLLAGIYDIRYKGKFTDSGEKYSKGALTASHASFPFGTQLRLTNPVNGRSVVVRINDGNNARDKTDLYLSKKAAKKLKMKKGLSINIQIEVLSVGKG